MSPSCTKCGAPRSRVQRSLCTSCLHYAANKAEFDRLFSGCTTAGEIDRLFREQAKVHHPDAIGRRQARELAREELARLNETDRQWRQVPFKALQDAANDARSSLASRKAQEPQRQRAPEGPGPRPICPTCRGNLQPVPDASPTRWICPSCLARRRSRETPPIPSATRVFGMAVLQMVGFLVCLLPIAWLLWVAVGRP